MENMYKILYLYQKRMSIVQQSIAFDILVITDNARKAAFDLDTIDYIERVFSC